MSPTLTYVLLGGSAAIVVLGGLAALLAERRRRPAGASGDGPLRGTGAAPVALAVGVCLLALGLDAGAWCLAAGGVLAGAGLFGVVRGIRRERAR